MLGTVKMPDGTIATLEDDGYWTNPTQAIQSMLNLDYSLHGEKMTAACFPVGGMMIEQAATAYGGEAFPEQDMSPLDPDVIY